MRHPLKVHVNPGVGRSSLQAFEIGILHRLVEVEVLASQLSPQPLFKSGQLVLGKGLELNELFKFSVNDRVDLDVVFRAWHLALTVPIIRQELGNKHLFQVALMSLLCFLLQAL